MRYELRARRIMEWTRGNPQPPVRIEIPPTDRCNLRCRFCWQAAAEKQDYFWELPDEKTLFSAGLEGDTFIAAGPDRMSLRQFMTLLAPDRTPHFISLPMRACNLACRIGDAAQRAIGVDLPFNSCLYDTFTVSRTFNVSKTNRLLGVKFTPMAQALAESRAASSCRDAWPTAGFDRRGPL